MQILNAFLCCGAICALGQLIYEQTKLTAGHITSLFVVPWRCAGYLRAV